MLKVFFLIGNLWIDSNFLNSVAFIILAKILRDRPDSLMTHPAEMSFQQFDVPTT